ncbi:gamma-glutamyltransferase [Scytonema sp. PRP1]|uniref:gamma-glutamyltransferase n=1 Tax=Scytonema sp. PRP1 TaxID=3120513 RepID=UPI002FD4270A
MGWGKRGGCCCGNGDRPIIPGFLTQDHQPIKAFGVMGGAMQPQGHLQVVVNLVDYGMNPQAPLDDTFQTSS